MSGHTGYGLKVKRQKYHSDCASHKQPTHTISPKLPAAVNNGGRHCLKLACLDNACMPNWNVDCAASLHLMFSYVYTSNLSYSDRLAALNLPSLELRRLRNDLIWCYKILFGVVEMSVDNFFELVLLNTRVVSFKLFKRRSNTCARSSFFSVSV